MRYLNGDFGLEQNINPGLWQTVEWPADFWLTLFDGLRYPVLVMGEGGKLIMCNSQAAKLLDLGGMVGSRIPPYLEPLMPGDLPRGELDPGAEKLRSVSLQTPDGAYTFTVEAMPFKGYGRLLMATGMKEWQYWPAQALNGDGLDRSVAMAGEVSQKVMGPLAGIELYASILDEEVSGDGDHSLKSLINEIRKSLKDVNEYLTGIESMSRDVKLDLETLNLIDVIDEALGNMDDIFKAKHVRVWFDQKPIYVLGDRRLLVQIYMNLFLNAVEAMVTGGRLTVRMNQDANLESEVVVTDTGPGIDYDLAREVFNPFYTTKGKSLGLGLPVTRRIIEAHDGSVSVGSELTAGARIVVRMPSLPARVGTKPEKCLARGVGLN
ncbi:MAG: HAMP domain-containing histidine kinase [Deltaproteobacteria bacterium]|jgi:signal transduction histidine kinase|nr:HAMP domain-containing histidine kinase [Deltaproteobacteria bacterium]